MSKITLKEEVVIDFRLSVVDAEMLLHRLKNLGCGDSSELYRQEIGVLNGKAVVFVVGLKQ